MMEGETYKQIERFLSGAMSDTEMEQFQKEILSNSALKEEVALYQSINFHISEKVADDHISYDSEYKRKLEEYIRSEQGKKIQATLLEEKQRYHNKLSQDKSNKSMLYYILSTAAAVVFVIVFFFMKNSDKDLYTDYYKIEELPSFTSRSGNSSLLASAKSNFKSKQFDKSLSNFKEYVKNDVEGVDPLIYIYTGLIYSEKNQLEKAIEQFTFLENSDDIDNSRALWYKVLVYLKFDKKVEAKKVLAFILKDPNNYKYKEAKEILEKLKL
ncbi:tetratricopeptide repeat protein [Aquimarina rubra]|uniref:Tol-pal system YbgF family protein n=1 Tax=Aquimarina rubra TaxID=1920033 RepID=A0ABW5L9R7_9FLAO